MKIQCLWYALDKWRADGGYLMFRRSSHWCIPHVLHLDKDCKTITHYVPPGDLKYPWMSVLGFAGNVIEDDPTPANPASPIVMFLGTCLLFILGGAWAVRYYYLNMKRNLKGRKHAD